MNWATAAEEAQRLDLEHVVHVYDPLLGLQTVFGPFPGPVEASLFAEQFVIEAACAPGAPQLGMTVIPLDPPDGQTRTGSGCEYRAGDRDRVPGGEA